MCEPTTIAMAVAIGATAASGGLQAKAAFDAGEAEAKALRQERDAEQTAAVDSLNRGASDASRVKGEGSRVQSENKVALAGSGIDVASASALDILEDTRRVTELDALTIRNNARREAWGHEVRATQLEYGARQAKYNGRMAAAGSFLGALGQGAGMYAGMKGSSGGKRS